MLKVWTLPAMLALTVGLVGCDMLPTADEFGTVVSKLSSTQRTVATSMIQDTVATLNVDAQLNVASMYTDDGSLRTQALVQAVATGSTMIELRKAAAARELLQRQEMAKRMQARLKAAKANFRDFKPTSEVASDGSRVDRANMTMMNKNDQQNVSQEKFYDAEGTLIEVKSHFTRTHKNGLTYTADRDRKLQEDGSWKVTFTSTITGPKGKTKTVAWTRTVAVDGSEVGDGTITRFDGSVVTVHVERSADGSVLTRTVDTRAKVTVDVDAGDGSDGATVKVTNGETGQVAGTQTVEDTKTVDPSAL